MKERMLAIEKALEDTGKARVDVLKMIYGGSKIVIGRYTKYIKEPISRMSFTTAKGIFPCRLTSNNGSYLGRNPGSYRSIFLHFG